MSTHRPTLRSPALHTLALRSPALRAIGAIAYTLIAGLGSAGIVEGQSTQRVSVGAGGSQANGWSGSPSLSRDGRWLAFDSDATNLVPTDTNALGDVFRKDLRTGAIVLLSVGLGGAPSNGSSFGPVISGDGRFVAFTSDATNLVAGDINGAFDVFLRDVTAGTTTLVSVSVAGGQSADAASLYASITPNGRFVAFYSFASDLVSTDGNGASDAFVFDRLNGTVQMASLASSGAQGNDQSVEPASWRGPGLSDDGRFVAFVSEATNLAPGVTNLWPHVYVRDTVLGTTAAASVNANGIQANLESHEASISADGRWVAFMSDANNLVPGDTSAMDFFVKDMRTGEVDRVSVASGGGQGGGGGFALIPVDPPSISPDGRYIAFAHKYTNLVPGDTNHQFDVFLHDRWLVRTERLSLDSAGDQGDAMSKTPTISGDGTVVAFASLAGNLVAGDTNTGWDVFLRTFRVPYAVFCVGDGTAGTTACPCGNPGSFRKGCENSANRGGAVLFAEGAARVGADTITLHAARQIPNALVIFLQASAQETGGSGSPFGDGLQCLSGTRVRLAARRCSPTGLASFGSGISGDPLVSARGSIPPAGGTRYYQTQYRDAAAFCTAGTFNTTNGITIAWGP